MQIEVHIKPATKQNTLAAASVELVAEDGTQITIDDCRVLQNKAGVIWFSLPTYSITNGRSYEYFPAIKLNPSLHRRVRDAVLDAFEQSQFAEKEVA